MLSSDSALPIVSFPAMVELSSVNSVSQATLNSRSSHEYLVPDFTDPDPHTTESPVMNVYASPEP